MCSNFESHAKYETSGGSTKTHPKHWSSFPRKANSRLSDNDINACLCPINKVMNISR